MKVLAKSLLRHSFALAAGLTTLAAANILHAQPIVATGTFSDTPNGGSFNYVISLKNSSTSTSPIGTFWYAWTPGQFFLPSSPSSVTPPTGWTDIIQPGSGRFSIEFTANSPASAIQPGSSLNFDFTSADSPTTLAGPSAVTGDAVGLSFLYSGDAPFSGSSLEFTVTPAPEPSSLVLVAIGSLTLLFAMRRKARVA